MKITRTIAIDVTDKQLGWAVLAMALKLAEIDDPGTDYYTDGEDNVYMGVGDQPLGYNPRLAAMVNAANYLIYGRRLTIGNLMAEKTKEAKG